MKTFVSVNISWLFVEMQPKSCWIKTEYTVGLLYSVYKIIVVNRTICAPIFVFCNNSWENCPLFKNANNNDWRHWSFLLFNSWVGSEPLWCPMWQPGRALAADWLIPAPCWLLHPVSLLSWWMDPVHSSMCRSGTLHHVLLGSQPARSFMGLYGTVQKS